MMVMVMHSDGSFVGSKACNSGGLGTKGPWGGQRYGGIIKFLDVTAALFPEGFTHVPLPFNGI